MIGFNNFYGLATCSHVGNFEIDSGNNLGFSENRNETSSRARIYDALLQSLEGDAELSARPEVQQVVAEISALKEVNASVTARDVRKWQRQIQAYISFGTECVTDVPVKEDTDAPVTGDKELSSALVALEWEKSMLNRSDADVRRLYENHLQLAYEKFSRNCESTGREKYQKDYSDRVVALSGKLITGSRLGENSADLGKSYEELVAILGELKVGSAALSHDLYRQEFAPEAARANNENNSGLSREVLGWASEAIDIFMVTKAQNDSYYEKDLLVLQTRAHFGSLRSRDPKANPRLRLQQLRLDLSRMSDGLGNADPEGRFYYMGCDQTSLVRGDPRGTVRIESRLEPRFVPRSRGKWKKVKDFFYPSGAIKEKQRVSDELRKICEESGMFKPEFLKNYWEDEYTWSFLFEGRGYRPAFPPRSDSDDNPFFRMEQDTLRLDQNLAARKGQKLLLARGAQGEPPRPGLIKRLFRRFVPGNKLNENGGNDEAGMEQDVGKIPKRYKVPGYKWADARRTVKPWEPGELKVVLDNMEAKARRLNGITDSFRSDARGDALTLAFPIKKSQDSGGFSIPELLGHGNSSSIRELDGGGCLYTLGNDTFLLSPADLKALQDQIIGAIRESRKPKSRTIYARDRIYELTSGEMVHGMREDNSETAMKICHSYAVKKIYNHWLTDNSTGSDLSFKGALARADSIRGDKGVEKTDYQRLKVSGLGEAEISVFDEPYCTEFKKVLRDHLMEIPEGDFRDVSNALEVLRDMRPPYSAEKVCAQIYDDKVEAAVDKALERVRRMAYVNHARQYPEQVLKEVGKGRIVSEREARMELFCNQAPRALAELAQFRDFVSGPPLVEPFRDLHDPDLLPRARIAAMLHIHTQASVLATLANKQIAIEARRHAFTAGYVAPERVTTAEVMSFFRDAWGLNKDFTPEMVEAEKRAKDEAPPAAHGEILDKMKATDGGAKHRELAADLFDQVAEETNKAETARWESSLVPLKRHRVDLPLDFLAGDTEARLFPTRDEQLRTNRQEIEDEGKKFRLAQRPETPPVRAASVEPVTAPVTAQPARALTPEIAPAPQPARALTPEIAPAPQQARAPSPEIAPATPQPTRAPSPVPGHTAAPVTRAEGNADSLENDLLALKFFLWLPEKVSGEISKADRTALQLFVESGEMLLPEKPAGAEKWFEAASQAVDDPRVRAARDVAKLYSSHLTVTQDITHLGYDRAKLHIQPNELLITKGEVKEFRTALDNRPRTMDMRNVGPTEGSRTRLHGSTVRELSWESVDDVVSDEAAVYVKQFFQGAPGGIKADVDADYFAHQTRLLKTFISSRSLRNNPPTYFDIQKQLQKQVGVFPGAHASAGEIPPPLRTAVVAKNLEEFKQKYYLPVSGDLQKRASQDSVISSELRGKVPSGAKALKLNPSDQELRLCFLRVLPLAIAADEREARVSGAEKSDPERLEQQIRYFVGKVIWGRYIRENEISNAQL